MTKKRKPLTPFNYPYDTSDYVLIPVPKKKRPARKKTPQKKLG